MTCCLWHATVTVDCDMLYVNLTVIFDCDIWLWFVTCIRCRILTFHCDLWPVTLVCDCERLLWHVTDKCDMWWFYEIEKKILISWYLKWILSVLSKSATRDFFGAMGAVVITVNYRRQLQINLSLIQCIHLRALQTKC